MKNAEYQKILIFFISSMLCQTVTAFADTAISVPQDARRSIENAKNDLEILKERKREIQYKKDAADYVDRMQQSYHNALIELEAAKKRERQNEFNRQKAEEARDAARTALEQARTDYDQFRKTLNEAYLVASDAQREAERILQDCYEHEAEIQREVDAANQAGVELSGDPENYLIDWAKAIQAKNRANQLQKQSNEMAAKLPDFEAVVQNAEQIYKIADAQSNLAGQKVIEAQNSLNLADGTVKIFEKNLQEAELNQSQLLYRLAHPPASESVSQSMNYYSWRDSDGNKGSQFSQPLYYGYYSPQNQQHIGIFTSFISASHRSNDENDAIISTTDTSLQFDQTNEKEKYSTKYILHISLPTGKPTLSNDKLNTRMSDDLVEFGQYGEGFKFQPGLETSWYTAEADKWTIGTSYLWSQAYDQTADIANDKIHPGYEWEKKLQYQHAEDKWQLVSELIHTNYGRTSFDNGDSYHMGNEWKYRITYNQAFKPDQDILFYYWQENSGSNNAEGVSSNYAPVHYYGMRWTNSLDEKKKVYLHFDGMNTQGNRYAGFKSGNYGEVKGRDKYTLGAGYEFKIDQAKTINFDLQYFKMHDGISTLGDAARSYRGWNLLVSHNRSW